MRFVERWLSGANGGRTHCPPCPKRSSTAWGGRPGKSCGQLHTIPAPAEAEDWEQAGLTEKIDRKIRQYRECPFQYENGEAFIRYMEENRRLLRRDGPSAGSTGTTTRGT